MLQTELEGVLARVSEHPLAEKIKRTRKPYLRKFSFETSTDFSGAISVSVCAHITERNIMVDQLTEGLSLVTKAVQYDKDGFFDQAIDYYDKSLVCLEKALIGMSL